MLKTYFCKLVSGFSLNLDQTTAVIFSGISGSIIIKKKLKFVLWLAITGSFKKGSWPHIPKLMKPKRNLKTLQNLVKTCVR